jgi:hypothetical protein
LAALSTKGSRRALGCALACRQESLGHVCVTCAGSSPRASRATTGRSASCLSSTHDSAETARGAASPRRIRRTGALLVSRR